MVQLRFKTKEPSGFCGSTGLTIFVVGSILVSCLDFFAINMVAKWVSKAADQCCTLSLFDQARSPKLIIRLPIVNRPSRRVSLSAA